MAIVALLFSIFAVALALGLAAWLWLGTASVNDDDCSSFIVHTGLGLEDQRVAGRTPL